MLLPPPAAHSTIDMAAQADGGSFKPDYKAVREAIAHVMEKDEDYDDGEHGRA